MVGTDVVEDTLTPTISAQIDDRRRTGRMDYRNPSLIALLRGAAAANGGSEAPDHAIEIDDLDPLGAARGVALAVVLSGFAWAVIGGGIWLLFALLRA